MNRLILLSILFITVKSFASTAEELPTDIWQYTFSFLPSDDHKRLLTVSKNHAQAFIRMTEKPEFREKHTSGLWFNKPQNLNISHLSVAKSYTYRSFTRFIEFLNKIIASHLNNEEKIAKIQKYSKAFIKRTSYLAQKRNQFNPILMTIANQMIWDQTNQVITASIESTVLGEFNAGASNDAVDLWDAYNKTAEHLSFTISAQFWVGDPEVVDDAIIKLFLDPTTTEAWNKIKTDVAEGIERNHNSWEKALIELTTRFQNQINVIFQKHGYTPYKDFNDKEKVQKILADLGPVILCFYLSMRLGIHLEMDYSFLHEIYQANPRIREHFTDFGPELKQAIQQYEKSDANDSKNDSFINNQELYLMQEFLPDH